ncbi:MAG TPA: hypothetical protein VMY39_01645 [Planctomycetota bacterium]|nr:hypothetical protein [Planctomycetota bacterium]HUV38281.1 hypothetical protein [Planctomycetota bacterium]
MRKIFITLSFVIVLLVAGCVKYDERIELNPDGSGVVRMHLSIVEQAMPPTAAQEIRTEDDLLPMPREELVKDLEKDGFTVRSLRAESLRGMRHFYVVLAFKDLSVLTKSEWFGQRKVTLQHAGVKWAFAQEISVSEETLTGRSGLKPVETPEKEKKTKEPPSMGESIIKQLEVRYGKERVAEMLKSYEITFSVRLRGAGLLRTNGKSHRDQTAVWSIPLNDLVGKTPTLRMSAEFAGVEAPPAEEE